MTIIIAGAGIGGLTAALCLAKAGHKVQIFEQSQLFAPIGAGIQCGANAIHVLSHLGLLDKLSRVAVRPQRVEFNDFQSGQVLHSIELGEAYVGEYGAPYLHLHRADLQEALVSAATLSDNIKIEMNACIQSYFEEHSRVRVSLSDGREFDGECLIGADGIRSTVRAQMLGSIAPRFTGNVAWRAVVPVDRLPENWMDTVVTNFVGPKQHAVLYYLRNQQLANLVGVVEDTSWTDDSWVETSSWEKMKADFSDWHPTIQAIIDAADKDQCYRWALYDHAPLSNWSTARITLLGDAAHATLPFMAAGASLAIEDARILQRALDQTDSVKAGLQLYQRNRMKRTARIQSMSSKMGMLYHINNSFMRRAAFKAIGMFAKANQSYLPDYNANTVHIT
jgi:salicylate hydroxylase